MCWASLKRYAEHLILAGVVGIIWFSALTEASHDLWSATYVFMAVTVLVSIYGLLHYRYPVRIKLPLFPGVILFLGTIWLSFLHSYDIGATLLEAWGWTYAFLYFLFGS